MRYILVILFLFSIKSFAQSDKRYNTLSLELGAGIHIPMSPTDGITRSKYIAPRHFQLSGRYMFNQNYGIKAHYSFNGFKNPDNKEMTLNYHRIGAEGVVNISNLLDLGYPLRENFGILGHAGVGITFARPYSVKGTDHLGHIIFGITPQYKLSEKFSLFGDISYVLNFKQHYAYNGVRLNTPHGSGETGGFVNVSFGVIMNFGNKRYHADWY